MLNLKKNIELIISTQCIFISSLVPFYISIPSNGKFFTIVDLPVNWQIPTVLILTILFSDDILLKAHTIYLTLGLFFLPLFYDGGSLGYILTPNFGYLLGIYPLIKIVNKLNKEEILSIKQFFSISILALVLMHLIGILFFSIQLILFNKIELITYNIGKYTLSKIIFEILLLFPISILLLNIKKMKFS